MISGNKFAILLMTASAVSATSLSGCLAEIAEGVYQEHFASGDDFWLARGGDEIDNEWWWSTDMDEMYDLGQDNGDSNAAGELWYLADFEKWVDDDDSVGGGLDADDWGTLESIQSEKKMKNSSGTNLANLRNQVDLGQNGEGDFEIDDGSEWADFD